VRWVIMGMGGSFSGSEGPSKNELVTFPRSKKIVCGLDTAQKDRDIGVSGWPINIMSLHVKRQQRHGDTRTMNIRSIILSSTLLSLPPVAQQIDDVLVMKNGDRLPARSRDSVPAVGSSSPDHESQRNQS